jgi:hypothetical protein
MLAATLRTAGTMRNPWISKNPFMSMWLSAANRSAGVARGKATAAAKREIATAQADAMRQFMDFWAPPAAAPRPRKKARR